MKMVFFIIKGKQKFLQVKENGIHAIRDGKIELVAILWSFPDVVRSGTGMEETYQLTSALKASYRMETCHVNYGCQVFRRFYRGLYRTCRTRRFGRWSIGKLRDRDMIEVRVDTGGSSRSCSFLRY